MRYYLAKFALAKNYLKKNEDGEDKSYFLKFDFNDWWYECAVNEVGKREFFCAVHLTSKAIDLVCGVDAVDADCKSKLLEHWGKQTFLEGKFLSIREIDGRTAYSEMDDKTEFYTYRILRDLTDFSRLCHIDYSEAISHDCSPKTLSRYASNLHISELKREAERIDGCASIRFCGHPVHYLLQADDADSVKFTVDHLVGCLHRKGRLVSNRILICDAFEKVCNDVKDCREYLRPLYEDAIGGTLMMTLSVPYDNGEFAHLNDSIIEIACQFAVQFSDKVLTIIHISPTDNRAEQTIRSYLHGQLMLITLREQASDYMMALQYFRKRAKADKIQDISILQNKLKNSHDLHYISELSMMYQNFYSDYLRQKIYPSYVNLDVQGFEKKTVRGNAVQELQEMIGLQQVKEIVQKSISFFKLQKLRMKRGLPVTEAARSMVFTGTPGTAKTTVARLVAQIFRENHLLNVGDLIEVGRADLVGRYVGQTAPQVKKAFERAEGSVLFIDEAYSLVDDRHGLYGDEAINTIVQEMENRRDNVLVIFAGYPKEMESFLERNPGLRSRIAFHVDFPDYNPEELFAILELMVKNKSMKLSEGAAIRAKAIFEEAVQTAAFGNGRFVRNLLEQATMRMSERLLGKDESEISNDDLILLTETDFQLPEKHKTADHTIGF